MNDENNKTRRSLDFRNPGQRKSEHDTTEANRGEKRSAQSRIRPYQSDSQPLPTTRARRELYRLVAQFRKESEEADDPQIGAVFARAVKTLSELIVTFKLYEEANTGNQ